MRPARFRMLLRTAFILVASLCLFGETTLRAEAAPRDVYPASPLTLLNGGGLGGGADRFTRTMADALSDRLDVRVKTLHIPGGGSRLAAAQLLALPAGGHTLFAVDATRLITTILSGKSAYTLDDFRFINLQWFDVCLFAVHRDSAYGTLPEVLDRIARHPGRVSVAVGEGSVGHLLLRLLLRKRSIPESHVALRLYDDDGDLLSDMAEGKVDLMIAPAQGSEPIMRFLRPLAVADDARVDAWDAPTLKEALAPLKITIPALPGAMWGFALPEATARAHPHRYKTLVKAFKAILSDPERRAAFESDGMGAVWIGSERAKRRVEKAFATLRPYARMLE